MAREMALRFRILGSMSVSKLLVLLLRLRAFMVQVSSHWTLMGIALYSFNAKCLHVLSYY